MPSPASGSQSQEESLSQSLQAAPNLARNSLPHICSAIGTGSRLNTCSSISEARPCQQVCMHILLFAFKRPANAKVQTGNARLRPPSRQHGVLTVQRRRQQPLPTRGVALTQGSVASRPFGLPESLHAISFALQVQCSPCTAFVISSPREKRNGSLCRCGRCGRWGWWWWW